MYVVVCKDDFVGSQHVFFAGMYPSLHDAMQRAAQVRSMPTVAGKEYEVFVFDACPGQDAFVHENSDMLSCVGQVAAVRRALGDLRTALGGERAALVGVPRDPAEVQVATVFATGQFSGYDRDMVGHYAARIRRWLDPRHVDRMLAAYDDYVQRFRTDRRPASATSTAS